MVLPGIGKDKLKECVCFGKEGECLVPEGLWAQQNSTPHFVCKAK